MKLATFTDGASPRLAVVTDGGLVDLAAALPSLPRDMIGLMGSWPTARTEVARKTSRPARLPRAPSASFAMSPVMSRGRLGSAAARSTRPPSVTTATW